MTLCSVLLAHASHGQGALSNTDYSKSQNTGRDLANSLAPAKPSLTKGEKKSEVDPKTLQSKTMKDPAFQGGLNDLGLDWNGDKMGKPHGSSDSNSTAAPKKEQSAGAEGSTSAKEKADSGGEKGSKTLKSDAASGVDQAKAQKPSPEEKHSNKETAAKADGDR